MSGLFRLTHRGIFAVALIGGVIVLGAVSALVAVGQTTGPGDDPSAEPVPVFELPDSAQSIIVEVFFNSPTDVDVVETAVSEWPAAGRTGGPPLISVEVLDDSGGLLEAYNAWHPLWIENDELDDDEDEDSADPQRGFVVEQSGEGVFIFPFYPNIGTVEISDVRLGQSLVEVDAHQIVVDYCIANGSDPACDGVPGLCVADVDRDGELTLRDLWELVRALWSRPGDVRWNPAADLNSDGIVDAGDVWILLTSFHDPACA